jgi:uncharacterized protein (TIGR01244 family)
MHEHADEPLTACAAGACQAVKVESGCLVGGAPGVDDLPRLAAAGLHTLVDFRPASEWPQPDWADRVRAAGIRFEHVPVNKVDDLTPEVTRMIWRLWQDDDARPMLLHCASGNRAAAALALAACRHGGRSPADALDLGRRAGLTKLLPAVQACPEFAGT